MIAFGALVNEFSDTIEVLRAGRFVDAHGKTVEISQADLDAFVANFEAGAAGQDVPFDIDHAMGEAAGWLRGLRREGPVLVATPEWNDLGRDLIARKIYRYISATLNQAKKVIVSLSLVNFPAVKGLKPLQLSTGHPLLSTEFSNLFFFSQELLMSEQNDTPVTEGEQPNTADLVRTAVEAELAQFRQLMADEIKKLGEQRNAILADTLTNLRDEQELIALSNTLTSTGEHALPLTPSELQTKLSSIPKPYRQTVVDILKAIHSSGTVSFVEVGTAAARQEKRTLSPAMLAMLKEHLADGGTKEKFFADNADLLGKPEEYDL